MRKRQGFTLVELMVAMALIIFIMSILSYAFVAATTTFRDLKAAGDMAEKLRSATTVLQRDLAADHFAGRVRLSDPNFWLNGPPRQGFFRIWQASAGTLEGRDLDGIPIYRSTDHALHFAVHLRGNRLSDFFTASVPAGSALVSPANVTAAPLGLRTARYEDQDVSGTTFNSQWAEVVYFLRPALDANGNQETAANGTPLFTLYRRQLLLVPDNNLVQQYNAPTTTWSQHTIPYFTPSAALQSPYLEVSCWQGYPPGYTPPLLYFNSPFDVTVPQRRFGMDANGYPRTSTGAIGYPTLVEQTSDPNMQNGDQLLTDVISFDVRVLLPTSNTDPSPAPGAAQPDTDPFIDLFHQKVQAFNNGNVLYPAPPPPGLGGYTPPRGPQVFDTWTSSRDALAATLTNMPPPLNGYAPYYDYSSWGQAGSAAQQTAQVSIPLWANNTGPTIKAIQITIRIWDSKTQQTRQVTLVQAT
jgi:prepilin-type N-terminal cleavage/methylation domain-containing protein